MNASSLTLTDAAALLDQLLTPTHLRDPARPLLALEEHADAFEMRADLPTLRPDELEIYVGDDYLELAAEHRAMPRLRCCLLRADRRLSFSRRYPLSLPVAVERADARLVGGELLLRLPKRPPLTARSMGRVRIPVSG